MIEFERTISLQDVSKQLSIPSILENRKLEVGHLMSEIQEEQRSIGIIVNPEQFTDK